jgi:uncharacterized protein YndB with AHSA1/START domain
MLKKILIVLALIVAAFAVVVALQPSSFRVERSAVMLAPPPAVFAQVNDFHHWDAWSPWAKLDPAARTSFEGPEAGTGAVFRWAGNHEVGEGSMTITESVPSERIRIRLDFLEPLEGTSDVEFTFKPEGEGTRVTWSMAGENNFVSKAICMFMDMDEMVGGMYEKGLANLGSVVQTAAVQ